MSDVLALVTDLFFQARVNAACRAAGRSVAFITSNDAVSAAPDSSLALVDLDATLDVPAAIRSLKAREVKVVAFGPHLNTKARKAAKAAGADRVLAKSKFVADLPAIIGGSISAAQDLAGST